MAVDTKAMGLIVEPLAVIDVSISMDEPSFSVSFVFFPPSFVHGTVGPDLTTLALSYVFTYNPLAIISSMILKLNHGSILNWVFSMIRFFLIIKVPKLIADLLDFLVVIVLNDLFIVIYLETTHVFIIAYCSRSQSFSC